MEKGLGVRALRAQGLKHDAEPGSTMLPATKVFLTCSALTNIGAQMITNIMVPYSFYNYGLWYLTWTSKWWQLFGPIP